MQVRGAFNHLFRPGLRSDFRDQYREWPEEYPMFLHTGTQTEAEIRATQIAGLPRMVPRGEGEPITYIDPVMGPKIAFTDDEFGLGHIISRKMVEDDLYGKANQSARYLARSARLTQEHRAAALLDDAFTGAEFLGVGGLPLIHSAHTLLASDGTQSNLIPGNPLFSIAGLQAAFDLAHASVDETGEPVVQIPTKLIIGAGDIWVAEQIMQGEYEPFSADYTKNVTRSRITGGIFISHFKSDPNSWFLQDPMNHDAWFLFKRRPEYSDTFDFETDDAKYKATQRINVFFFDYRGWWGSNPA